MSRSPKVGGTRIAAKTRNERSAKGRPPGKRPGRLKRKASEVELGEAREQQAATANILKVISQSNFDLQAVLAALVKSAVRLCDADTGIIRRREEDIYPVAATFGFTEQERHHFAQYSSKPDRGSVFGRAILEKRPIHVPDLLADRRLNRDRLKDYAKDVRIRSGLGVPLLRDGIPIGVFTLQRRQQRPYTKSQIELVETFAHQAVIAIENTRLFNEVQARTRDLSVSLQQQTATADVLKVISRSAFDVQTVLDTLVESATRLCGADHAYLFQRDGDFLSFKSSFGQETAIHVALRQLLLRRELPVNRESIVGRSAFEGRIVHVADVLKDPEYVWNESQEISGFRAAIGAPLLRDSKVVGVIFVGKTKPEPFTEKQIELVATFADQAVIAIENTRLFNETREALERQTATGDVLKIISRSSVDLETVLETLVQTVGRLCRADQVYMFHLRHDLWHLIADHGLSTKAREFFKTNPFTPGRGSTSGRAATELRAVSIADVLQDPEYTLGQGQAIAGYRSTLGVPLLSENRLIGVFSIARTRVEPFASKEIELATSFADQAVIAIENARLFNETQEALERQTATSEVLQVINSSPRELAPVFDAMLKRAMRLCEAAFGGLWVFEGEHYVAKALCGVPSAYAAYLDQTSVLPGPHTAPYRFLQGERSAIQNFDLAAEEPYLAGDPQRRALVDLGGARSALQAPLIRDEKVLGVITVYRQETGSFSGQHVTLIQNFAEQAAIAIENARLFDEVQNKSRDLEESLQQQTATAEVLQVINSSPGHLEPVFAAMLEKATQLCEASFGILWLCDGEQFRTAALHGVPPAYAEITRTPIRPLPTNPLGRMLRGERLIVSADVSDEEPYRTGDPARRALVDLAGARSVIQVALAKEETFLGSLTVYRKEVRPFSEKQIALLQNFAAQAVIAIENVKLFEQVQAKTSDLEESLQQQTATADVLKAISRSAFDLNSVLSTLVGSAAKLCEAERGLIFLRKGNLYHTSANFGFSPELEAFARANPLPADGKSTTARAGASGSPVQAVDLLADETQGFLAREYQRLGGHRTNLGVPLRRDGETIGVFTLTRQTVQAFTPRQIELVQTFADQAVIAIENSRLLEQVQAKTRDLEESLQQQTATADVLKAISRSAFDLKAVLNALIEAAARLCEADQGTIARRQGQVFVRVATWGFSDEFTRMVGAMPVVPDRGSAVGRALLERATVHIPNVDRDPEYNFADAKRLGRFKTIVAVPMLREGTPIGVLSLTRIEERPFTPKQLELVSTFTDQAAIAIENVRLFEQVQAKTQELSQSLEYLRAAQDRLVQTEKLASLGQLTAGIAHEIKNPLNFVNNFSALSAELVDEMNEVLADAEIKGKKRKELDEIRELLKSNLEKVVQHGKRADSIVKNMLLHSRQGAGEHRPVEINALVDESLNLAYHGARAEKIDFNIALQRDFDPGAGMADVYPQEITRVLLNLLSNGFYAATKRASETDSGFEPKLWVATKDLADRVEIRVRDNGTGIPSEVRNEIFNPFFTTKPAGEGTGLGLSMSHDIVVKQHGGTIEVETEVGAFTEFRIVLLRTGTWRTKLGEQG